MFDITPDDISRLNDIDLRELVGRLCEAELFQRGLSPVAVTWGGAQTAADGGLDVRVALPVTAAIDGFVPRKSTGFQVKTPDMPRAEILTEMRPSGAIRSVIQDLAHEMGAYIIVSSHGSTADGPLRARKAAMREALVDVEHADDLHTDFYDRTRLATWVRQFPGLITWTRERVGRALAGWHPYGAWAGGGDDDEYLVDGKLRLHMGERNDTPAQPIPQCIDDLRDELARSGRVVRLVGLSGVGKTRLAQALFDSRIGARALAPSLAVYTNLSDDPSPQPIGLASDVIATGTRAILVVDNCPPDLHRRLADVCSKQGSTVSVLTIEYDVRDDQPEQTRVVTLDTSSPELIEQLVARRYPYLSRVDARTLAEVSGGNARIAIALAETVKRSGSIAGLSNDELFDRLFRQRHQHDNALLIAAQVCSLVYSFEGEFPSGDGAELPRLAALAGQSAVETYRHVDELFHRNLVQRRGVWRAVLPHAIANRLAVRALDAIPYSLIEQALLQKGADRLARSFSRRLSFLHGHPSAEKIVQSWLEPNGLLGSVFSLNELGMAMFQNVAPVSPDAALAALERAATSVECFSAYAWRKYLPVLRSIAYEAVFFERCTALLVRAAVRAVDDQTRKQATDIFASLFTLYLSGTHATIEQRLHVTERLIRSADGNEQKLGLAALAGVLQAVHFGPAWEFDFGARPRDFGYRPKTFEDQRLWYTLALSFIERLALTEGIYQSQLLRLLGEKLRPLWMWAHMHDELEALSMKIAARGFWREGWEGCRQIMRFDGAALSPDLVARVAAMERALRPAQLEDKARAVIHGDWVSWNGLDEPDVDDSDPTAAYERLEAMAFEVGTAVVIDNDVFASVLPDLLIGGVRVRSFGRGLAQASPNIMYTWEKLVEELERTTSDQLDIRVLTGFMAELWERDRDLAQQLFDSALESPVLLPWLPDLSASVTIDERCVGRLKQALNSGLVPVRRYESLAYGGTTAQLSGPVLADLLLDIARQPDGYYVALEILHMRFYADRLDGRVLAQELIEVGRDFLRRPTFRRRNAHDDYNLGQLVEFCVTGPEAGLVAADAVMAVRRAVESHEIYALDCGEFIAALAAAQPKAVLDVLFGGNTEEREVAVCEFQHLGGHRASWIEVIPVDVLEAWCAQDPTVRFPLAASFVTFAHRPERSESLVWTEQARMLLTAAPSADSVLKVFVERFWPTTWSGSRAAIAEDNAKLLDSTEVQALALAHSMVAQAKAELAKDIEAERQRETKHDRERDGRFE